MNAMNNNVDLIPGNATSGNLPGGAAPTLMNPVTTSMNAFSTLINRQEKEGVPGHRDRMDQTMTELQQKPEALQYVDMGGKDIRPGDMTAQFNPNMDQETHLYSGRGDRMVIIV